MNKHQQSNFSACFVECCGHIHQHTGVRIRKRLHRWWTHEWTTSSAVLNNWEKRTHLIGQVEQVGLLSLSSRKQQQPKPQETHVYKHQQIQSVQSGLKPNQQLFLQSLGKQARTMFLVIKTTNATIKQIFRPKFIVISDWLKILGEQSRNRAQFLWRSTSRFRASL